MQKVEFSPRRLFRKEIRPDPFKILELENLNDTDFREFKRKVKKNKGVVQILVHPFFREDINTLFDSTQEYKEERDSFVNEALANGVPLVIFEEEQSVSTLPEYIISKQGTMYIVPTLVSEGRPASMKKHPEYNPHFMGGRTAANLEFAAWRRVIEPLKKAGVKKAVVGGRYMVLIKPGDKREKKLFENFEILANGKRNAGELVSAGVYPDACPGQVINTLLNFNIDVSISSVSSPTNTLEPTERGTSLLYP